MYHRAKNSLLLYIVCAFVCLFAAFQQLAAQNATKHFIYVQSDKNQPFYVILNHKSYESSSIGYLIISKLDNGEYNLKIGFPQDKYPSQTFLCKINGTDAGYGLKYINASWKLINLQTREELALVDDASASDNSAVAVSPAKKETTSFGDMLGQVSGSKPKEKVAPVVAQTPVAAVNNKVEEKVAVPVVSNDNVSTATQPTIVKINEVTDRRGVRYSYVDASEAKPDTIEAFIPNVTITPASTDAVANTNTTTNPFYTGAKEDNKTVATETQPVVTPSVVNTTKEISTPAVAESQSQQPIVTGLVNSSCVSVLSDKELNKVKGKMIDKNDSPQKMIAAAQKAIGAKCISTEQVKSLGNLLLSDEARLALYRALYDNVYDAGQFGTLESQLLDAKYKSQFRTLIGH